MGIRFQADADFNHLILLAVIRREPTMDFQTATAGGLVGLSDSEVLAQAASMGRLLVTHDQRTMPRHFGEFVVHSESSGVLVVTQSLPIAVAVDEILLIHGAMEAEEWINRIAFLPL